jgi:ribonuclease BN (tRNA processing enzyme)
MDFYKSADHIVHDCECTPFKSGVHAHFDDLATLAPEVKAKMLLVHYQDVVLDKQDEWDQKAKDAGFIGFARPGSKVEL